MPLTLKEINAIAPELVSIIRVPGGSKFVNEPNGELDPDKFLDNDEYCWEVSTQRLAFHAKKLIITDWEKESVTSGLKLTLLTDGDTKSINYRRVISGRQRLLSINGW